MGRCPFVCCFLSFLHISYHASAGCGTARSRGGKEGRRGKSRHRRGEERHPMSDKFSFHASFDIIDVSRYRKKLDKMLQVHSIGTRLTQHADR